jgi:hypothetical protein
MNDRVDSFAGGDGGETIFDPRSIFDGANRFVGSTTEFRFRRIEG